MYGTIARSIIPNADLETGLKLLELKGTDIEKYQYLTHLRATNVHLFYRLLAENLKVRQRARPGRARMPGLTIYVLGIDPHHLHSYRRRSLHKVVGTLHPA